MASVKCPVHHEPLLSTIDEQALRITVGCSRCDRWLSSDFQPHMTVAELEWYERVLGTSLVQCVRSATVAAVSSSGEDRLARC